MTPPDRSSVILFPIEPNPRTRAISEHAAPRVNASRLRAALAEARATLVRLEPPRVRDGYRVFWSRRGRVEHRDLADKPFGHMVFGRHLASDVVLTDDEEISLRHLLVAVARLDDGTRALRVMDLRAGLPFFLEDDVPRRSIVATGAFALRVGSWIIGGIPVRDGRLDGAAAEHPYRAAPPPWIVDSPRPPRAHLRHVGHESTSYVTSVPPPRELFDLGPPARCGRERVTEFVVRGAARDAAIEVDEQALECGVLIGRDPRCTGAALGAAMSDAVSRIHLLVVRSGAHLWAFDVASLNGSFLHGAQFRTARLPAAGAEVNLGGESGVTLAW